MSRLIRLAAVAAVSAGLSAVLVVRPLVAADDVKPAAVAPVAAEEGFTYLFNGKDLAGWVYGKVKAKDGEERENKAGAGYQIKEGGVLFSTKADGGNLYTEKEYADFIFRFDFRLTQNANNGVGIRAPLVGDSAYAGMEIQVLDDTGPAYANLRPAQYHGSVYDVVPAKRGSQKPVGEWNTEEIHVHGTKIRVIVNDQIIVDADLADVKDEAVLKKHPGLKNAKGHIGFLGHGAEVEFRNVRIKEL
jgi:hypothetical protein